MKLRIAALSLIALCLTLAPLPAMAADLYDNGAINGNTDAWTINNGFAVSDTFLMYGSANIGGITFGAWLLPGDTLTSVEVSITSAELGGTTYFDQTVNFSTGSCFTNNFGYNVCAETASFAGPTLVSGTYWLNLQNASVPSGDPVYWDENSGPSQASESALGTIPSEAFTILSGTDTTTFTGTTPEPGSFLLFGSGLLGLAGVQRRKLF